MIHPKHLPLQRLKLPSLISMMPFVQVQNFNSVWLVVCHTPNLCIHCHHFDGSGNPKLISYGTTSFSLGETLTAIDQIPRTLPGARSMIPQSHASPAPGRGIPFILDCFDTSGDNHFDPRENSSDDHYDKETTWNIAARTSRS